MDDNIPTPNNTPPMQELSDTLRPAVEQVRAAVQPAEAMERSIDRAQRLGPPPPRRRSRRWLAYSTAAGIAALVLMGFGLWPDRAGMSPERVALNQPSADKRANGTSNATRIEKPNSEALPSADWGNLARNKEADARPGIPKAAADEPKDSFDSPPPLLTVKGSSTIGPRANRPSRALDPQSPASGPLGRLARVGGRAGRGEGISDQQGRGLGGSQGQGEQLGMVNIDAALGGQQPSMTGRAGVPGGMPGKQKSLDEGRGKDLSEARALAHDLKQKISEQELVLNKTVLPRSKNTDLAKRELKKAKEQLKSLETRITDLQSQVGERSGKNQPQVWHRDRGRPAFARVYIGDGNSLELVNLHVSVTIEGPRARTVVDHIFRNPHNRQLEGTFEYPLPSGASPSYFAMFLGQTRETVPALFGRRGQNAPLPVEALAQMTPAELVKHVDTADWGRLQEGRIVSKQKALETYEEVVRGRIDPALLEYAGGNTFSGRVFPIPPKGYNRVILTYEELLPFAQEQMIYRFPLPGCKLNEMQFRLQANAAECLQPALTVSERHSHPAA